MALSLLHFTSPYWRQLQDCSRLSATSARRNIFSDRWQVKRFGLTRREAQVLFQISQGKNSTEIATTLNMSEGTVRKHVEHIYEKFDVSTRAAAVMYAFQKLGMVP